MEAILFINSIVFIFSIAGILLILLINPLLLHILFFAKWEKAVNVSPLTPTVSLIMVVHNAEHFIINKIQNSRSLKYPSEKYEIILYSDGSTDETAEKAQPYITERVLFISSPTFEGKNIFLNKAAENAHGDVLVFSDVDAMLDENALLNLAKYFSDPSVGGVCGQRIIAENDKRLKKAQSDYIRFDSMIKKLESKTGSISSNDGKLYAIRKDLFRPIPPAVTDDLYTCLSIIKQGYRFLFEPNAKAFIKVPSRNPKHELTRRRRIVCRSLTGIFLQKELLNPFKYGIFSIRLFINKILRRFLPIYMLLMFLSSMFLSFYIPLIRILVFLQFVFYILALSYPIVFQNIKGFKFVKRITSLAYYFCLGIYGTLLGLIDFIRGKKVVKWEPFKAD